MTLLKVMQIFDSVNKDLVEKIESIEYFDADNDFKLKLYYDDKEMDRGIPYEINLFYDGSSDLEVYSQEDGLALIPNEIIDNYLLFRETWKNSKMKI